MIKKNQNAVLTPTRYPIWVTTKNVYIINYFFECGWSWTDLFGEPWGGLFAVVSDKQTKEFDL